MKHFQHFPKRGLLAPKAAAFARKDDGIFSGQKFLEAKTNPQKDSSRKRTRKILQVALAYSVHIGEKIAQSRSERSEKLLG